MRSNHRSKLLIQAQFRGINVSAVLFCTGYLIREFDDISTVPNAHTFNPLLGSPLLCLTLL